MGLFQRKILNNTSSAPLYTTGLNRNLLIVGLGNIGREYDGTRHNIGFAALDALAAKLEFPDWQLKKDLKCHLTMQTIAGTRAILIKPTTYMNLSGQAAQLVINFYKIGAGQTVAVYDELDIPFGQIRLRRGGSAAGHNGVKSLIEQLGEDFGRVRVGIGNDLSPKANGADFVLGKFTKDEREQLPALIRETNAILSELIHGQELAAETRSFII